MLQKGTKKEAGIHVGHFANSKSGYDQRIRRNKNSFQETLE